MDEKYCKGYVPISDIPGARVLSVREWLALKHGGEPAIVEPPAEEPAIVENEYPGLTLKPVRVGPVLRKVQKASVLKSLIQDRAVADGG